MSMILENSGIDSKVDCWSRQGGVSSIRIGDHEINQDDFDAFVIYYLTNTDLAPADQRRDLVRQIVNLKEIEGFNPGNRRYS